MRLRSVCFHTSPTAGSHLGQHSCVLDGMNHVLEACVVGNVDIGLTRQYDVHVVSFVSLFHEDSASADMVVQQEPSHLQRPGGSETGDMRSALQRSAKAHIPHNFWLKLLEKGLLGLQELGQALQLCTSSVYDPEQVKGK